MVNNNHPNRSKRLPAQAQSCMDEAHRRWQLFGHNYGSDIERAWIGLGYPREYKQAVELGLMRRHGGPGREKPRILGWYVFTDAGVAEYKRQHPNPAARNAKGKSNV